MDLLGVPLPKQVNGVEQIPLHGISMAHTLNDNGADTQKTIQYFETIGQRAIWHKGWKAVTFHHRGTDFEADVWELYNLDVDLAEIDNLADRHPEKLADLIDLWWREAERYGVLPLDDLTGRAGVGWWPEPRDQWVLHQDAVLPHFFKAGPRVRGVSHRVTARIERDSTEDDGCIIADGGRVRFYVNDEAAGDRVLSPFRYYNFVNEPLDVGRDSQTPVDDAYESPFVFKGRIVDVIIEDVGREVVDQDVLLDELMGSQ